MSTRESAPAVVADACISELERIVIRLDIARQVMHALVPRIAQIAMNTSFRMFPDSSAAKGAQSGEKAKLSLEVIAMQQMTRGGISDRLMRQ